MNIIFFSHWRAIKTGEHFCLTRHKSNSEFQTKYLYRNWISWRLRIETPMQNGENIEKNIENNWKGLKPLEKKMACHGTTTQDRQTLQLWDWIGPVVKRPSGEKVFPASLNKLVFIYFHQFLNSFFLFVGVQNYGLNLNSEYFVIFKIHNYVVSICQGRWHSTDMSIKHNITLICLCWFCRASYSFKKIIINQL